MATRLLLLHKKNLKGKAGDYYEIRHICPPSPLQKHNPLQCTARFVAIPQQEPQENKR